MNDEDFSMHRLIGGIASDTKHILEKLGVQDDRLSKHGDRLTELEKARWKTVGMATAIATVFPVLVMGLKLFFLGE